MFFLTPDLPIVDLPAWPTHFTPGRGGFKPRFVGIHHTGGRDSRAWLTWESPNRVSAHRLIDKLGTNFKIVDDHDSAHCAGFAIVGPVDPDLNDPAGVPRSFNQDSLNIEFENLGNGRDPYPWVQIDMGARQVVEWFGKFGPLAIVGHGWVDANKNDPLGFPWSLFHQRIFHHLALVLPRP